MLRVHAMPAAMLFPWLPKALCHHLHQAMCTLHLDQQLHLQTLRGLAPGIPKKMWVGWSAQGSLLLPRCTELACSSVGAAPPLADSCLACQRLVHVEASHRTALMW